MASNVDSISTSVEPRAETIEDNHENTRTNQESSNSLLPQYFAAFSATMGGMIMGTTIGWSGPALHLLRPNDTDPSQVENISSYASEFFTALV